VCLNNNDRIVFISGNFNVLHAGHIRLFAFARNFGSRLIVGVNSDKIAGTSAYIEQTLRLEAVETNNWVTDAFLIDEPIEMVLARLKPFVVVKGREFEHEQNVEESILSEYGGRLIFGSSELPLSSINMMRRELASSVSMNLSLPCSYLNQHRIDLDSMLTFVSDFNDLRVCVIGDLIIDEYISCESLGMSQEDPSLVVAPFDSRRFLGGAGIVAAHAAALGAESTLITITGSDDSGDFAESMLAEYGVKSLVCKDDSRPTTLKQRYRCDGKTLLRVSHLLQNSISPILQATIFENFSRCISSADLVVFSDFNYGCLPNRLVEKCLAAATEKGVICVADSQSSSQVGDVSRFKNMALISATEREVRVSLRDNDDGLTVIAERLRVLASAKSVMVKLGSDGVLLHMDSGDGRITTDQLPALNHNPIDVAGAGDSMLITTGMALALGATPWMASSLGSIAAGMQVGRLGNKPLLQAELVDCISASWDANDVSKR
tara:strand:+ start:9840 stop:11315 length:1476 start_codon:yes stop_codon:yes gene_type:complete